MANPSAFFRLGERRPRDHERGEREGLTTRCRCDSPPSGSSSQGAERRTPVSPRPECRPVVAAWAAIHAGEQDGRRDRGYAIARRRDARSFRSCLRSRSWPSGQRARRSSVGPCVAAGRGGPDGILGRLAGLVVPRPAALRYAQLSVAFHLMCAFLPYAGRAEPHWLLAVQQSPVRAVSHRGLYSMVLFGGLAIALLALDKLFGVDVPGRDMRGSGS